MVSGQRLAGGFGLWLRVLFMADVAKIVRERLKAGSAGMASHPDADTLTAFAERSLSARERDGILDHLSHCGDCRDIVALAMPPADAVEVPELYSRGKWLAWPALRWGFAAVGVVLVATFGIVQYRNRSRDSMAPYKVAVVSQAKNKALDVPAPSAEATAAAPASASPAPAREERDKAANSDIELRQRGKKSKAESGYVAAPAPPPPAANDGLTAGLVHGVVGGPLPHGPKAGIQSNQANQWQQNTNVSNYNAQAAATTPAQAAGNVAANGRPIPSLVQAQPEPPAPATENLIIQSQPLSKQVPTGGTGETKVDRAKPLETVIVSDARRYAGAPPSARLARSTAAVGTRWSITSGGGLQRSFDQGASWQDVNVNESAPPASVGRLDVTAEVTAKEQPQVAQKEITLKDQKQTLIFRAVAANGTEVWAGGISGLLYHSTDAGNNWTRVAPTSAGVTLTGDIVTVNFPDLQHGRISTSTSEVWSTSDDGQSWEKQ